MEIKLPKGEQAWVSYRSAEGNPMFIVTSKAARDSYTLYEVTDGALNKLGKSANPEELV